MRTWIRFSAFLLASLAPVACALGQQTWIVDAASGPGSHFSDLPPALQAAAEGDILIVRSGAYSPLETSKGVTVLGEGQPTIEATSQPGAGIKVSGLAAGRSFVLRGFRVILPPTGAWLIQGVALYSCDGHVFLENVDVDLHPAPGRTFSGASLVVSQCTDVTIANSVFRGANSISSSRCDVRDSDFLGTSAIRGLGPSILVSNSTGLGGTSSELSLCGGAFAGGSGLYSPLYPGLAGDPGLGLNACTTRIMSGAGISITAGTGQTTPQPIETLFGGTVAIEPTVSATIGGNATVSVLTLPVMRSSSAPLGGLLSVDLHAAPGTVFELYASLLADRIPFGPLGDLWLDPAAHVLLAAGNLGAGSTSSFSIPVPNSPLLRGLVLRLQALTATGSSIRFSDPSVSLAY